MINEFISSWKFLAWMRDRYGKFMYGSSWFELGLIVFWVASLVNSIATLDLVWVFLSLTMIGYILWAVER